MNELDVPTALDEQIRSLIALWDTTAAHVAELDDTDWGRPVADGVPGSDVTGLVTHLTGVHYAGPDRLREAIGTVHDHAVGTLRSTPPSARVLAAQCLDMCLHTHDLSAAARQPFDLETSEAAALAACRLVIPMTPRLLVAAGARDAAVRLVVRPGADRAPVVDRTVRVHDGAPSTDPDDGGSDTVDVTAAALLLVLAGRADADALAARGLASWSGGTAERFVHRARLCRTL
jgi:hypothetical protein